MEIEILIEGKGMQHAITETKATSETISPEPGGRVETWEMEGFTTAGQWAGGHKWPPLLSQAENQTCFRMEGHGAGDKTCGAAGPHRGRP